MAKSQRSPVVLDPPDSFVIDSDASDPLEQALASVEPKARKPYKPKREPIPLLVTNDEIEAIEGFMTAKQILLSRIIANELYPSSNADAYRFAYDYSVPDNASSLYVNTHHACANDKVKILVQALKSEFRRQNKASIEDQQGLRLRIASNLLDLAECSRNEKTRLGALRTLGQTVHARSFAQAEPDSATAAAGDLAAKLLAKLSQVSLEPEMPAIEASYEAQDDEID